MHRLEVSQRVAQGSFGRRSAIDGRTTHHAGHATSRRVRERIVTALVWIKEGALLRRARKRGFSGAGWNLALRAAACNLIRLAGLLGGVP